MIRLLLVLLLTLLPGAAHADELRPGYLEFTQKSEHEWALIWKSPMRGGFTPATSPVLPKACAIKSVTSRAITGASVTTNSIVHCNDDVAGQSIGLVKFDTAQSDVLARVAPLGRPVQALHLTPAEPMAEIRMRPDRWQVASTYFIIGVEHILFGYDHLLFVVCLVLLLNGLWTIAKAATAFTLAHSITLIGTTLGFLGLPQRPVEAIIALSIMFLAIEIVKKDPNKPRLSERLPWLVAFVFGLLHGFGFAGALNEIGLPESDVPTALLTFNLGVEAGQLLVVGASLATLAALQRMGEAGAARVIKIVTYAIGSISAYWLVERTIG